MKLSSLEKIELTPAMKQRGLIGDTEEMPACRKPDDRARHEDPGRGDHPDGLVDRHVGLLRQGSARRANDRPP